MLKNKDIFTTLLLLLPAIFFFSIHFYNSVNIPSYNEYQNCFETVINYNACRDISCKLAVLFSNDSEHRDLFPKLYNLIITKLNGSIDLRYMMALGHAGLILFVLLVFNNFKKELPSKIFFLPFCLLLFQPQFYRTSFNGLDTCLHFHVMMWAALSFYFALKTGWKYFVLSLVCSILSCYTNGNGIMALPIVSFLYFSQRRIWECGLSVTILLGNLFLYFHNFILPSHLPEANFELIKILQSVFILIGSHLVYQFLAFVFGVFVLHLFLALFVFPPNFKLQTQNFKPDFLLALALFIFASICMIAVRRYQFGIESILSSRYTFYSVLFSGILYLTVVKKTTIKYRTLFFYTALLFSFSFFILSWVRDMKSIQWTSKSLVKGITEWNSTGKGLAFADSVDSEIMNQSLNEGNYKIPIQFIHNK